MKHSKKIQWLTYDGSESESGTTHSNDVNRLFVDVVVVAGTYVWLAVSITFLGWMFWCWAEKVAASWY